MANEDLNRYVYKSSVLNRDFEITGRALAAAQGKTDFNTFLLDVNRYNHIAPGHLNALWDELKGKPGREFSTIRRNRVEETETPGKTRTFSETFYRKQNAKAGLISGLQGHNIANDLDEDGGIGCGFDFLGALLTQGEASANTPPTKKSASEKGRGGKKSR